MKPLARVTRFQAQQFIHHTVEKEISQYCLSAYAALNPYLSDEGEAYKITLLLIYIVLREYLILLQTGIINFHPPGLMGNILSLSFTLIAPSKSFIFNPASHDFIQAFFQKQYKGHVNHKNNKYNYLNNSS